MLRNILVLSVLAFCTSAFAQVETIKVVGKAHYKGTNRLALHQMANQQISAQGNNPQNYELVGVSIRAKSKRGRGTATLIVGQDQDTKTMGKVGGSAFFQITAPWAYNSYHWDLSQDPGQPAERWRMRFDGNIKVREIILHVQPRVVRVRIPYNDQLFKGSNTLTLKRELNAMGYDLRDAKLMRVVVVAKSRRGQGQAKLVVGQKFAETQTIGQAQNGLGFQSTRPKSYNRLRFRPNVRARGKWQVQLQGRIKVKAVIVDLK